MLKNGLGESTGKELAGRQWKDGKATGSLKPSVNYFCVDSTIFDTISGNQLQVAISNYSHYIHMDKNSQYNINLV